MEPRLHHRFLRLTLGKLILCLGVVLIATSSNARHHVGKRGKRKTPRTDKMLYMGMGTELTRIQNGAWGVSQSASLFAWQALEFRLANDFSQIKKEHDFGATINATGNFFTFGMGASFFMPAKQGNRRNRLRFGLEYNMGSVMQTSTYFFKGVHFGNAAFDRTYKFDLRSPGIYAAFLWNSRPEKWYLDMKLTYRESGYEYALFSLFDFNQVVRYMHELGNTKLGYYSAGLVFDVTVGYAFSLTKNRKN